jgi:hypothetical protein
MKMELALIAKDPELFRVAMFAATRVRKNAIDAVVPVMMEGEPRAVKLAFRKEKFLAVAASLPVQIMLANASAVMVVAKQHSKSVTTARAENLLLKFKF